MRIGPNNLPGRYSTKKHVSVGLTRWHQRLQFLLLFLYVICLLLIDISCVISSLAATTAYHSLNGHRETHQFEIPFSDLCLPQWISPTQLPSTAHMSVYLLRATLARTCPHTYLYTQVRLALVALPGQYEQSKRLGEVWADKCFSRTEQVAATLIVSTIICQAIQLPLFCVRLGFVVC